MPKFLVTGANGVLGRALLQTLTGDAGVELVAAVRSDVAEQRVREEGSGAEVVRLPNYRAESWGEVLRGIDAVAHTVGILKERAHNSYREAHEGSVAGLVDAAKRSGCRRVVYLSIVGAAAGSPNPCLASKARAEESLLAAIPTSLVLRLPMVIGGGDPASAALRAHAARRRAWLLDGGRARDQPIDVRDAAAAIARGLGANEPSGVLELAGPEALPHRELVVRVAKRLENPAPRIASFPAPLARAAAWLAERLTSNPPLSVAMLDVLLQDDAFDASAAWRALGLRPRPLDESLDHWFRKECA